MSAHQFSLDTSGMTVGPVVVGAPRLIDRVIREHGPDGEPTRIIAVTKGGGRPLTLLSEGED